MNLAFWFWYVWASAYFCHLLGSCMSFLDSFEDARRKIK